MVFYAHRRNQRLRDDVVGTDCGPQLSEVTTLDRLSAAIVEFMESFESYSGLPSQEYCQATETLW
jgi:hypothetical protein